MANQKGDRPKGAGRKGGTRFPNYSIKQIVPNLKEFISKTHNKPINIEQLNAGVFKMKSKSPEGSIKYSSMKQFGLADGEYSSIVAKELSSQIELSTEKEKIEYLRQAVLNSPPFKNVFETFQSSSVNKSRIKSYSVQTVGVHIDLADKFLKTFLESCEFAELCTINGEDVTFTSSKELNNNTSNVKDEEEDDEIDDIDDVENNQNTEENEDELEDDDDDVHNKGQVKSLKKIKTATKTPNIALQIDSTLDPDKLAKQLRLLRKYGLI